MNRIAALLVAFGLVTLNGPAAVADGGGREFVSPWKFEYSDKDEDETEADDDASYYSWLAEGSRGGFGYVGVRLSDSLYFQVDLSDAHVQEGGDQGGASSNDEIEFGSAYAYKSNVYFFPGFSSLDLGLKFDSSRPVRIVEEIDGHDDWSVDLSVGYRFAEVTPELRATYRDAADKGERLGGVFYYDNRFRVVPGLSFATTDDEPAIAPEITPEIQLGTDPGFIGAFQRGFAGEFGHIAFRVSKYEDFRVDLSLAYVVRDETDDGGSAALKDPFKAIAGLFSSNSDDADEVQLFGEAYIHRRNLYVLPKSLTGFYYEIDPERDISIREELEGQDDWGLRLGVGYKFNELTEVQVEAYQEAGEVGQKYADVYLDDENEFTLRLVVGFRY